MAVSAADATDERGAVMREIAHNAGHAGKGTQAATVKIGAVVQAAGETGHAAVPVLQAAPALSRESDALCSAVSTFLTAAQAA